MPYSDHVFKETNSQPGGKSASKTHVIMGPAVGSGKKNTDMHNGLGRPLRGKLSPPAGAKQAGK